MRQTLFEDTWLDARNIAIEVERGVVTLSGTVRDHMAARYAWDDAWESEGVRGVISRLEVTGSETGASAGEPPTEDASKDPSEDLAS